jgi:hypothetical protein
LRPELSFAVSNDFFGSPHAKKTPKSFKGIEATRVGNGLGHRPTATSTPILSFELQTELLRHSIVWTVPLNPTVQWWKKK